jgi:ATP adenylyltransferase
MERSQDLLKKVTERYKEALNSGALQIYMTECHIVKNGLDFIVLILKNLSERERSYWDAPRRTAKLFDPFLPYEKDLFVDDLSDTHICLLNKYNVMKNHILIVTRLFEDQESPLTRNDFDALWQCMKEIGGLAFYNSGEKAGASQRHKHMQMVPLPLGGMPNGLPILPLIMGLDQNSTEAVQYISQFDFRHGLVFLPAGNPGGIVLYENYLRLADSTGLSKKWGPYNLLITMEWMLLIPRLHERYEGISVNSLGFTGTLLVKDFSEFELIEHAGLFKILNSVGISLNSEEIKTEFF